jgi:hypothetical protein
MRSTFLIILLFVSLSIYSKSAEQRILIEQTTSASCPFCESANPQVDQVVATLDDEITFIRYQRGGGSYIDPMWSFNMQDSDGRMKEFYGESAFPVIYLNGERKGHPANLSQQSIMGYFGQESYFEIMLDPEFTSTGVVGIDIKGEVMFSGESSDYTGNMRLHLALVEEEINYDSPPGKNNETVFRYVMRKMFPNHEGTLIDLGSGNSFMAEFNYTVDTDVIDPSRLRVIAWVQDHDSKQIYQSAEAKLSTSSVEISGKEEILLNYRAAEGLYIRADFGNSNIEIFGIDGSKIISKENISPSGGTFISNTGNLAPGVYVAVIRSGAEFVSKKFIVTR